MPNHAVTSPWRRGLPGRATLAALAAGLAASLIVGCSGSKDAEDQQILTTILDIVASSSVPLRGVQADLRHGQSLVVLDVAPASALSSATCQDNVSTGRVQLGCVSSTDVTTPVTAWTLEVQHSTDVDPVDAVTSLQCTGADSTGNPVAVSCIVTAD